MALPQILSVGEKTAFMTDRLKPFSTDELAALLFSLDVAATVDPGLAVAHVNRDPCSTRALTLFVPRLVD